MVKVIVVFVFLERFVSIISEEDIVMDPIET